MDQPGDSRGFVEAAEGSEVVVEADGFGVELFAGCEEAGEGVVGSDAGFLVLEEVGVDDVSDFGGEFEEGRFWLLEGVGFGE